MQANPHEGTAGLRRGVAAVKTGLRALFTYKVVLFIAVGIAFSNAVGMRLLSWPDKEFTEQSAKLAKLDNNYETNIQPHLELVRYYDVTALIPVIPTINIAVTDAGTRSGDVGSLWWSVMTSVVAVFQWTLAVLVAGGFLCFATQLVTSGVSDWSETGRGMLRIFWRYLVLMIIISLPGMALSLLLYRYGSILSKLETFGLYSLITTVKFSLALVPFIIAVDDILLIKAISISSSTVWRRFSEAAVVVLGIGFVRYICIGPIARFITNAWSDVSGGEIILGVLMIRDAVSLLIWIILAIVEAWFCLSALYWWAGIRHSTLTSATHHQQGMM